MIHRIHHRRIHPRRIHLRRIHPRRIHLRRPLAGKDPLTRSFRLVLPVLPILPVALLVATMLPSPAVAQLPISPFLAAHAGAQKTEMKAFVLGDEVASETGSGTVIGVDLGLALPLGLRLGGRYDRHLGSIGLDSPSGGSVLDWGLNANEYGVFLEMTRSVAPLSPISPELGIGFSINHLSLADDLDIGGAAKESLDGSVDFVRIYGVAGLSLAGKLRLEARGGYGFGSVERDQLSFGQTITNGSGQEVRYEASYEGFFGWLGVGLDLF